MEQTKIKHPNTKTNTKGAIKKFLVGSCLILESSTCDFTISSSENSEPPFKLSRFCESSFIIQQGVSSAAVNICMGARPLSDARTVATSSADTADAELPQSFLMYVRTLAI